MPLPREIALIFDLDNTLIHSAIDFMGVRHRLIDLLRAHGAAIRPREELLRLALPELVELGRAGDPGLGDQMWEIIAAAERQGLEGAVPVEHAAQVLKALRERGHRLALLTNNARAGVAERLRTLGLEEFFEVIATRDDVSALKPAPDGITHILDRLPGIRYAYVVGDAWIDGRAAQAAGARFIGFGPKKGATLERGIRPWAWIEDLRELLQLDLGG